jgi:hypothetical protein
MQPHKTNQNQIKLSRIQLNQTKRIHLQLNLLQIQVQLNLTTYLLLIVVYQNKSLQIIKLIQHNRILQLHKLFLQALLQQL